MTDAISKFSVCVSILNWNAASTTLSCISSLLDTVLPEDWEMQIFVIDNASEMDDFRSLTQCVDTKLVHLLRNETNLGFAGGHNLTLQKAIDTHADFIWLLNNDATIHSDTLGGLIALAITDNRIAGVSPVLVAAHDHRLIDFCGGVHDWAKLEANKLSSLVAGEELEQRDDKSTWLSGAALLLRVSALSQVGRLDEDMFAYYEDNDISCKLLKAGWKIRVAFDSVVYHATSTDVYTQRPPYYFYLMARNSILFWLRHAPSSHRRLLRLRLFDREILVANRLISQGYDEKADACLLGIFDAFTSRYGKPKLHRPSVSLVMKIASYALRYHHRQHLSVKYYGR
jgi:GT2 family glycosyltransferase